MLAVDCSNGVGGVTLKNLLTQVSDIFNIVLFNDNQPEMLNTSCGSEYIQLENTPPIGCLEIVRQYGEGTRFCAIDGDADRLIYF